jgi:hypothetical protein
MMSSWHSIPISWHCQEKKSCITQREYNSVRILSPVNDRGTIRYSKNTDN